MGRTPAVAVVFFLVAVTSLSFAQTASSPAGQQKSSKDVVVRISVTLVQVDAVVTDKHGRQVTDLKPEDFEIREDGRPQQITHFGYVSTGPAPGRPAPGEPAPPPADIFVPTLSFVAVPAPT